MKTLTRIATALMVAALLWAAASYVEICTKNLGGVDGNKPHYSEYNLYVMLIDWEAEK